MWPFTPKPWKPQFLPGDKVYVDVLNGTVYVIRRGQVLQVSGKKLYLVEICGSGEIIRVHEQHLTERQ